MSKLMDVFKVAHDWKYKCPASRVKELWPASFGCLQFEKFSSKKCSGERNGPYVDVGKPPAKIYRLRQLDFRGDVFRELLQKCVFWNVFMKIENRWEAGTDDDRENVFFDKSSIWKIWSAPNTRLGVPLNLSKVYYSRKIRIISLIDDKIALRHFFGLLSIRGAVYAVYGTGGRLLEWANCIFVTLISYLGINAERQCPSWANVNFLSIAPAMCCSIHIVIFILLPIKIHVLCLIISFIPSLFSIASFHWWTLFLRN